MKCPKCQTNNGIIEMIDFYKYFKCLACGFKCFMKHYRGQFKK